MKQMVALYRSPSYSPNQHRCNDTAIMDAVVARLAALGWAVQGAGEADVEAGRIPAADHYLNMCQGPRASERLVAADLGDAVVVNRPGAVLNCHRHRLVPAMVRAGIPFPATLLLPTDAVLTAPLDTVSTGNDAPIWIKRGDVHAETREDVIAARPAQVAAAIRGFAARGVKTVALQAHVPGPIVKFYGVTGGRFFHWYLSDNPLGEGRAGVDGDRLAALAFAAADALGLHVFGGDAALPSPTEPVLVDINDWPSFAPVRDAAADAIAAYVHHLSLNGRIA